MKVFIGCSSSTKIADKYFKLAYEVAYAIAKENHTLVYGGTSYSMMGECYRAFVDSNRDIIGIMAEKYKADLENVSKSESFVVKTSLERIMRIYEQSDAFVVLPGGSGTIEELFSILEENRTNKWKKVIIYNYEGHYDFIINWLNMNINTGFTNEEDVDKIIVVDTIKELIKELGVNENE